MFCFSRFDSSIYAMERIGQVGTKFRSTEKGELEERQEVLQDKAYTEGVYSDRDVCVMEQWSHGICEYLSLYMNGEYYEDECPSITYYTETSEQEIDVDSQINAIHRVIANSPRLNENTIFFRAGLFDSDLEVGDISSFESFSSTTYQRSIANNFMNDERYMIKIYAPEGSRGVLVNDDFENPGQHEWLLDKGQKYVVISKDDENREVEILLLKK